MTGWDVVTWIAIAVLGPGALLIFIGFLGDVRRLFGSGIGRDEEAR